jgi:hypothetical protein
MNRRENITRIKPVHNALQKMASEVVFVGGATVSLYNDRAGSDTRPTDDVDILVEVAHYTDYAAPEDKLRQKGFINDVESPVICRYKVNGIIVDVMPTGKDILGFSKTNDYFFRISLSTKIFTTAHWAKSFQSFLIQLQKR